MIRKIAGNGGVLGQLMFPMSKRKPSSAGMR